MTVKQHKESWIKGASDVCMIAGTSWDNGINPVNGKVQTTFRTRKGLVSLTNKSSEVNDIEIRSFSRNEVKKKRTIYLDFTYYPSNEMKYFPAQGDYLYYAIFERDHGTLNLTKDKQINITGTNFTQTIHYRSNESPYALGRLKILPKDQPSQSFPNSGWATIDNEGINFKVKHK